MRFLAISVLLMSIFFNSQVEASNTLDTASSSDQENKQLVYIASDTRIPFWKIMGKGIQDTAIALGYSIEIGNANNDAKRELELAVQAIRKNVSGIIISPTTSSASVTVLELAKKADIPVVISDIGADSGDYVSFICSDNKQGAYNLGKILAKKMKLLDWGESSVGIIAIPQKRRNGQDRTAGFMQAMNEKGIKLAGIAQQVTFSYQETYDFSTHFINKNPELRAIWLQGSNRYQAALDAINDSGKQNEILLISFDAEPIFLDLIPQGVLTGAAMQQPYLMGQKSVEIMNNHHSGEAVKRVYKIKILAISPENIADNIDTINRNVLGIESTASDSDAKN